jgi:hypothetical protein
MSWSMRVLLVAILLNALKRNSAHNKPKIFDSAHDSTVYTAWAVTCYCCDREWAELLS